MERTIPLFSALSLAAALAACGPAREAGVADPDVFRATASGPAVASSRSATEVAACFEARAVFLPMSSFAADPATGGAVYRLRGFGRTYEEVVFAPETGGGSTARVLIAPNLDATWREGFARDRGRTLEACAEGKLS
jgi:hypothetical protein